MKEILLDMGSNKSAFAIGCGHELPCMHEQLDTEFVNEQKESPTFNPLAFQREYESIWTGSSEDSLVSLEDLNKCRVLSNVEEKATGKNSEYILSYDVARAEGAANAQSALVVIKISDKGDGTYSRHVVNVYSFEGTHFLDQAIFLKKKVNEFKARMLCVDANGLGRGLVDYLVTEVDENPAYEVVNDDRYSKYRTSDSIPILFNVNSAQKEMKSSDIHNVFVSDVSNHRVKLLKSESAVKSDISKNKKISTEKLVKKLQPFLMSDIMCDEIMNLQYKQSGNTTKIKQISRSINKDKFSALEYGLFWIYLEEQKNKINSKTESIDLSSLFSTYKKPKIRS